MIIQAKQTIREEKENIRIKCVSKLVNENSVIRLNIMQHVQSSSESAALKTQFTLKWTGSNIMSDNF